MRKTTIVSPTNLPPGFKLKGKRIVGNFKLLQLGPVIKQNGYERTIAGLEMLINFLKTAPRERLEGSKVTWRIEFKKDAPQRQRPAWRDAEILALYRHTRAGGKTRAEACKEVNKRFGTTLTERAIVSLNDRDKNGAKRKLDRKPG